MTARPLDGRALLEAVRPLVTHEPELQVVLNSVARAVSDALGTDGCLIYRVATGGELVAEAVFPVPASGEQQLRLPAGFGVTGRVAADGIAVTLVDDSPRNLLHRQLLGLRDGQRVSRLCVPARDPGGTCVAVLALHALSHRVFHTDEIGLSQQIADLLGLRLSLERSSTAVRTLRAEWDGLVAATVAAQETERRRVAADLHDGVSQVLAGLTFHLSAAEVALGDADLAFATEQVRAARRLADLAVGETRSAITGLHSPVIDDLGLAAGLASLAHSIPSLHIDVDAQEDLDLPEHVVISLFRIAQEAVQNVVKHAAADKAELRLARHGRSLVLTVSDDGAGFDTSQAMPGAHSGPRYGLASMAERVHLIGGRLRVNSQPGQGTTVEVRVPLPAVDGDVGRETEPGR
ncbi:MAG: GAF domain-containing sensor histidine kinase [Actinobacteria bacterium]|nr:GAF domain-containing sensor histidine kinase [Actinomycetota bacterium]